MHKVKCKQSDVSPTLKMVSTLMALAKPVLFLQYGAIVCIGVHSPKRKDKPYIVRCDLFIEAEHDVIEALSKGNRTASDYPHGVQGMLQVKSLALVDPKLDVDEGRLLVWKQAHNAGNQPQYSGDVLLICLVDFHMEGTDQIITLPISLTSTAFSLATQANKIISNKKVPVASESPRGILR